MVPKLQLKVVNVFEKATQLELPEFKIPFISNQLVFPVSFSKLLLGHLTYSILKYSSTKLSCSDSHFTTVRHNAIMCNNDY